MDLKEAYRVLIEMLDSFESWYPMKAGFESDEMEMRKNRFAVTKLNLELGEYTGEDYEYLLCFQDLTVGYPRYTEAIKIFIEALSLEYGWINGRIWS